jgi:alkanesulfonate monooxygenase SsuD/methylene tetrahydromethanopterin reductase-like flavin-dependent oxidoreductase (luciferase family)
MALAVRHGDGLVTSVPANADGMARMWARLDAAAVTAGRTLDRSAFLTATLTTMVVLRPGETVADDRVREACGAFAIAGLHYQYEQWKEAGRPERPVSIEGWDRYVAMLDATDPERLHQRIHQGHNCWVIDEEWEFVTPQLIEATCLVGTAADLGRRLNDLGAMGLGQVTILPPLAVKEDVLREVATEVMPLLG